MFVLISSATAFVFAKGCGCGCGSKRTAGCAKPEGGCCVGDFISSIIFPTFLACSSRVPSLVDSCSRPGRFAGATVLADVAGPSEPKPRGSAAPLPFAYFVIDAGSTPLLRQTDDGRLAQVKCATAQKLEQ